MFEGRSSAETLSAIKVDAVEVLGRGIAGELLPT